MYVSLLMYDKTPILGSIPAMKMGQVSAESTASLSIWASTASSSTKGILFIA